MWSHWHYTKLLTSHNLMHGYFTLDDFEYRTFSTSTYSPSSSISGTANPKSTSSTTSIPEMPSPTTTFNSFVLTVTTLITSSTSVPRNDDSIFGPVEGLSGSLAQSTCNLVNLPWICRALQTAGAGGEMAKQCNSTEVTGQSPLLELLLLVIVFPNHTSLRPVIPIPPITPSVASASTRLNANTSTSTTILTTPFSARIPLSIGGPLSVGESSNFTATNGPFTKGTITPSFFTISNAVILITDTNNNPITPTQETIVPLGPASPNGPGFTGAAAAIKAPEMIGSARASLLAGVIGLMGLQCLFSFRFDILFELRVESDIKPTGMSSHCNVRNARVCMDLAIFYSLHLIFAHKFGCRSTVGRYELAHSTSAGSARPTSNAISRTREDQAHKCGVTEPLYIHEMNSWSHCMSLKGNLKVLVPYRSRQGANLSAFLFELQLLKSDTLCAETYEGYFEQLDFCVYIGICHSSEVIVALASSVVPKFMQGRHVDLLVPQLVPKSYTRPTVGLVAIGARVTKSLRERMMLHLSRGEAEGLVGELVGKMFAGKMLVPVLDAGYLLMLNLSSLFSLLLETIDIANLKYAIEHSKTTCNREQHSFVVGTFDHGLSRYLDEQYKDETKS
ncbi:uncharacterized protein BDR25DRAFT_352526 [Lindgomyces ingoldianus]|uniref:Uncharacterized protein n=1 Tax=Lindgomyces ingoldianus TaxID=673940 RepID=A0ACB6R2N8_9PLEO|nr:uncharacterized protein BDR25DRAFT_352526 [Lindgomyces ingoldianus]KAF2473050.1 hypothetical protein BDR25DRAFT_352526 [Lindgomyces ingoldianus]